MRTRKEIETDGTTRQEDIVEVLLDIREISLQILSTIASKPSKKRKE